MSCVFLCCYFAEFYCINIPCFLHAASCWEILHNFQVRILVKKSFVNIDTQFLFGTYLKQESLELNDWPVFTFTRKWLTNFQVIIQFYPLARCQSMVAHILVSSKNLIPLWFWHYAKYVVVPNWSFHLISLFFGHECVLWE